MTPERIAELRSFASWHTLPMRPDQTLADLYKFECRKLAFALAEALGDLDEVQKQHAELCFRCQVVVQDYDIAASADYDENSWAEFSGVDLIRGPVATSGEAK